MTTNFHTSLTNAKITKNDEFYTRLTDISKELEHYKEHFKDKIVLCNCDNPTMSAFWEYFHINFSELGLRKLIATYYDPNNVTYKTEYNGGNDSDIKVGTKTPLKGHGDFRGKECQGMLDEVDIVATNPPFSLFRDYIDILMQHNKKFLIVGHMNAIAYKDVFPLFKDNKVWLGVNSIKEFDTPSEDVKKFGNIHWFTNLTITEKREWIKTTYLYSKKDILYPNLYPKYDNYDAINVDKVSQIPMDYKGVMGVPKSFMDKFNSEQFELVSFRKGNDGKDLVYTVDGKKVYPFTRILIRFRQN